MSGTAKEISLRTPAGSWNITLPSIKRHDPSWDEVSLIDFRTSGRTDYLLLLASGPSKGESGMGYCGGGFEETLIWMSVQAGRSTGFRFQRIGSCYENIESTWFWAGPQFHVDGGSLRDGQFFNFRILYDTNHPERGFATETKLVRYSADP